MYDSLAQVMMLVAVAILSVRSRKWVSALVWSGCIKCDNSDKPMSTVSSTDFQVWKSLANPEIVDVDVELGIMRGKRSAREAALRSSVTAAAEEEIAEENEVVKPNPFRKAVAAAIPLASNPPREVKVEKPEPEEESNASSAPPSPRGDVNSEGDTERREKQGFLIELASLQKRGVLLTRNFTMADSLMDIQFEFDRQTSNLSTLNTVSFMRDSLKLAITGIELANNRLGPILAIDGWAESVTTDMSRYDHALERLYKRYWRKTSMSPVVELAFLILGSAMTYHFKTKFFGPQNVRPPAPMPPSRPPARAPTPVRSSKPKRPTLRPPVFVT